MNVMPIVTTPSSKSYVLESEESQDLDYDFTYWVVTAWFEDSKVTDHISGDLMIQEWRRLWDREEPRGRERRASSLERAWLSTLIEVPGY